MATAIPRQKDHADRIAAHRGQFEAHLGAQESVGDLHQDAGTITGAGIGSHGPAVRQADQDLQTLLDDTATLDILDITDEAHATGIMLVGGVIESLRLG